MDVFKKFYKFIFQYKKTFIIGSILIILAQVIGNYSNYFVQYLFDAANDPYTHTYTFINIIFGFIIIQLFAMIISVIAWTVTDVYIFEAGRDLRLKVLNHLHDLDFSYHANKKSGSLISLIRRGDGAFFSFSHEINREILIIIVDFVFILFAFSSFDYRFSLVIIVSILIMLFATVYLLKDNIKARKNFNKTEDEISGIIADNLLNFETVKFFAKEKYENRRLVNKFKEWMARLWKYSFSYKKIEVVVSLLQAGAIAVIFYLCVSLMQSQEINNGAFALILTFTIRFYPQLYNLIFRLREIAKNHTDLQKYLAVLDIEPDVKDIDNALIMPKPDGNIVFRDIIFSYKKGNKVINKLNLTIKKNESVALVGTSGAGKTTLVKLLLRFYNLDSGKITINGVDISKVTKSSLRSHIGLVPQEPVLFNESIAYNISYPNSKCSKQDIENAARSANLNDFIDKLPLKYETEVGERGIKLSGGQKQRLAIARVFLANTPIVVFDEATSQLDSFSEKLIQDAFWRIAKDKTSIIIAHRLSTVMRADRIIVLENGKIVEEGSHKQLSIKKNGLYRRLWDMQRGGMLIE